MFRFAAAFLCCSQVVVVIPKTRDQKFFSQIQDSFLRLDSQLPFRAVFRKKIQVVVLILKIRAQDFILFGRPQIFLRGKFGAVGDRGAGDGTFTKSRLLEMVTQNVWFVPRLKK